MKRAISICILLMLAISAYSLDSRIYRQWQREAIILNNQYYKETKLSFLDLRKDGTYYSRYDDNGNGIFEYNESESGKFRVTGSTLIFDSVDSREFKIYSTGGSLYLETKQIDKDGNVIIRRYREVYF